MEIRSAASGDLPVIAELLHLAGLPALHVGFCAGNFRIAHEGGSVVGAIGMERYGDDGLLRSLVIAPQARSRGAGQSLVCAIEDHAREAGLRSLVLLTTTAERFFRRLDYQTIPRSDMPAAVQRSAEFSTLCPASAICMRKALDGNSPP